MCYRELPDSYTYLAKIDLEHNKRQFLVVNLSAVLVFIAFIAGDGLLSTPWSNCANTGCSPLSPCWC